MKVPAPGDDEITVDMIKPAPTQIQECIFQLIVNMWREADNEGEQKHWSSAVHKAVVLMLYERKGNMQSLDHYRVICLLSMVSRVLARMAMSRCSRYFESLGFLVNVQWGFRRERSTRDVILIARIIAELSSEWERNLGLSRAAMERAGTWDRNAERWETEHSAFKETQPLLHVAATPRQPMWDLLKKEGLHPRILAIFVRLHGETSYIVRLKSGESKAYTLKRGVRELVELNEITPGIRLRCSSSLRCNDRMKANRRDEPQDEETLRSLHTLGFADDTTTFPSAED